MTELVERTDENLPAARIRLEDAVSAIADPKPRLVGDRTTYLDPLYTQLVEAICGVTGERSGANANTALIWPDAFDLKNDIDKRTRSWIRYATSTIDRFHKLEAYGWRLVVLAERTSHNTRMAYRDKADGVLTAIKVVEQFDPA